MIKYKTIEELGIALKKIKVENRLKEIREEKGLSLAAVRRVVGVSEPTVRQWEYKNVNPRAEDLVKLSILYGVPIEDLLTIEKTK